MSSESSDSSSDSDVNQADDPWGRFQNVVHPMTIDEIKERYKDIGILSQNRNATVRLYIHIKTGERVVMKILNKSSLIDPKKRHLLYQEITTLQALGNHKHISELYEVIDSGDRIWIVIEYAAGGELFYFAKAKAPFSENDARDIFRPIVKVVAYMHSKNLVHRDLKLENVLLDSTGRLLLADFGFSRRYEPEDENDLVNSFCGTPQYEPPEIIKGIPYNPIYVDSWSLGVILFVLLLNSFPFNGNSIPELFESIEKAQLELPSNLSPSAKNLLNHLITPKPEDRYTPQQIMEDQWFNKNRIPHPPKPDYSAKIHARVLHDLGLNADLTFDELYTLDEDDLVSYKIIHRKYQTGAIPLQIENPNLPKLNVSNSTNFDLYHPISNKTRRVKADNSKQKFPLGMDSANARMRFPTVHPYLQVVPIKGNVSRSKSKNNKTRNISKSKNSDAAVSQVSRFNIAKVRCRSATTTVTDAASNYKIRKLQTMRLKMVGKETEVPRMNCQYKTLDNPEVVWKKLLDFLEKEENISIITEQDFGMYLLITEPRELHFTLNLGCFEPGIGIYGISLYKIRGEESDFRDFERKFNAHFDFLKEES